jgi:hypothetical protein
MRFAPLLGLLCAASLGACAHDGASAPADAIPRGTAAGRGSEPTAGVASASAATAATAPVASSASGLPLVQSLDDVRRTAGQRVEVRGRYEVTPVPGGKRLQPACIVLADGTRLVRSYRPVGDELPFDGLPVVVVGRAYPDAHESPSVQQVMAPHVYVESLNLNPLVSPYSPGESQVRTPPTVQSAAELERLRDHWVQLFGTLLSVQAPPNDPDWATAVLALPDGSRVELPMVWAARYRPLVGQQVSLIALVDREPRPTGLPQAHPSAVLCPGRVERCGMDGRQPT